MIPIVPLASNATSESRPNTVFLDRDGVINRKMPEGQYVRSLHEFHLLPGVPQAIARLNRAGSRVIVVSNQRGISLGLYTVDDVNTMHAELQSELAHHGASVDAFYFCPHGKDVCNCRKPLPGLYEQAVAAFPEIAPAASVMVGDSLSDIEFGRRLGMRTVFITADPTHRKPGAEKAMELASLHVADLPQAVEAILSGQL